MSRGMSRHLRQGQRTMPLLHVVLHFRINVRSSMPAPCPTDCTGPARCWRSARWLRSAPCLAPCSSSPSRSVRLVHTTPRQAPRVKRLPTRTQHQRRRRSRLPPRLATELSSVTMRWQRWRAPERLWSGRSSGVCRKRRCVESEESTCRAFYGRRKNMMDANSRWSTRSSSRASSLSAARKNR